MCELNFFQSLFDVVHQDCSGLLPLNRGKPPTEKIDRVEISKVYGAISQALLPFGFVANSPLGRSNGSQDDARDKRDRCT